MVLGQVRNKVRELKGVKLLLCLALKLAANN